MVIALLEASKVLMMPMLLMVFFVAVNLITLIMAHYL